MIVTRTIPYRTVSGIRLYLDVYQPEPAEDDLYPQVIVFFHGGGFIECDRTCVDMRLIAQLVAAEFAVVSVDYRLAPHATLHEIYEDCRYAVNWVRENLADAELHTDTIGAWGISAGGHLAALLGVFGVVDAVCDHYGSTDLLAFAEYGSTYPGSEHHAVAAALFGKDPQQAADWAQVTSPARQVTAESAPFLIVHGKRDTLVPFDQSERLHNALRKQGVESTLVVLDNAGHEIPDGHVKAVGDMMIAFFDQHLRGD